MMRDWAGYDSESSSDELEVDSAGPGEGDRCGSGDGRRSGETADVDVMGSEERRLRPLGSARRPDVCFPGRGDEPPPSLKTAVAVEGFRETPGLDELFNELLAPGASPRGIGESRRTDKAEAVR
jgi:hypothetical protein